MNKSFSELIEEYEFFIPSYQRAYSWTEKQVSLFIADLAEHAQGKTTYYLGHYILESENDSKVDGRFKVNIVDGQQRITTVAIFLAVCHCLRESRGAHSFLKLSVVEYDKPRFDEMLLSENIIKISQQDELQEETASLERVALAAKYFYKSFFRKENKPALLSLSEIDAYIDVISKAVVSVGVYNNENSKAVASQIFELHNTRGVILTETEKVKALLIKYVYLNNMKQDVSEIQNSFSQIFKLEEKAASVSFRGEMSLDDILAHHLRAVDDGKKQEIYTQPQSVEGENGCVAYVRKKLSSFSDNREEGVNYVKNLAKELAITMNLVSKIFVENDVIEPLIGDVILLDQRRSMIFLLLYFRVCESEDLPLDHTLLKRWESFLFLWDCHDVFYNMKSGTKDRFSKIFDKIQNNNREVSGMLQEYYSGNEAFAYRRFEKRPANEDDPSIIGLAAVFHDFIAKHEHHLYNHAYDWGHWHGRYKYWLYKYEIDAAGDPTSSEAAFVRKSLRRLFKENDVTLDHIVPRQLDWKELSQNMESDSILESWDPADKKQAENAWKDIQESINGIGNLLLLSRSDNSSLQNMAPHKRALEYKTFGLVSASYNNISEWKARCEWNDMGKDPWQFRIQKRGKDLLTWMRQYFTKESTWNS